MQENYEGANRSIGTVLEQDKVIVMALCESERLGLRPNVTYRFEVRPGCQRCAELAAMYEA